MKTLQEQYNLIKEGKGDKAYFMKLARYNFPDLVTPVLSYGDAITVLKNKSILSEGIGGLVTTGKKQDWHAIFNENIEKLKEKKDEEEDEDDEKYKEMIKRHEEEKDAKHTLPNIGKLKEAKEVKAIEKETTKDVTDMATRGYNYKDEKNYDNVFGQEFLKGFYTEMQDEKNKDKGVEELRQIVAKNLAKDISHYVKDGQFGLKDVGYVVDAPGLGETKPAKGKHKSSGYGDLKESILRSQIYLLVKEVLAETSTNNLSEYSDDAIADMIINLSRFEGNEEEIQMAKAELARRKSTNEAKKPSAGLTKKEKSAISKKAHAGKDIGKKGKGFEKVAKAAEKQYGSKEAGEKVAAAAMWKSQASKKK